MMAVFGYEALCVKKWRVYVVLSVRANNVVVVWHSVKCRGETVLSIIVHSE